MSVKNIGDWWINVTLTFCSFRCVLNWFGDWSNNALYQVGKEFTSKIDLEKTNVRCSLLYFNIFIIAINITASYKSDMLIFYTLQLFMLSNNS